MTKTLRLTVAVWVLAAGCWAQDFVAVQAKGNQTWPSEDAEKVYLSACSAVQREFGSARSVRPQFTLVLGADKNEALWDRREIRLVQWDPALFAQGVVVFAFEELMPPDKRIAVARRAVNWADATVEIKSIPK